MELRGKRITVHDMTLRDGMHPKRHLMTLEQMKTIAVGLDEAGIPLIEVTHGDGLGGSSVNYGFPAHTDEEYLSAVIPLMKQARVSALLLPGIGTVDHLKRAHELGVSTLRVATHCTEADVSEQHIGYARKLGMDTVGFLMMAHMNSPEGLVQQAKLMEGYGANCIYVTDSAGHLLPETVKARIGAVRAALKPETELGFHGHHNLAMGVANSLAAIEAGATRIDAAAAGLGAGAGNTPMEVLIAVCELMGIETGVDVFRIQDVAEDLVVPIMDFPIRIDRDALTLGYAGVYGSFLLFAKRAAAKYGVPAREILVELGRRGMVGGQEDMIEDTALTVDDLKVLVARFKDLVKQRVGRQFPNDPWDQLLGAVALAVLGLFAPRLARLRARLAAVAIAGAAALASVLAIEPKCLGDPLGGLDPLLRDLWLSHVVEAQPLLSLAATAPSMGVATAAPVLLGLLSALLFAQRAEGMRRALGPFSFQPSEFAKLVLILVLAQYYSKAPRVGWLKRVIVPGLLMLPGLLLILKQPDLGSGLSFVAVYVAMLLMVGVRSQAVGIALLFSVMVFPFVWEA